MQIFSEKKLDNSQLIKHLYSLHNAATADRNVYYQATIQVIIEFLEYLLTDHQGELHKNKELLEAFVFDLGNLHILDEKFFSFNCSRNKTNHTFFHFYDSLNVLFFNKSASFKARERFSIFGLRHAMEIKFQRVIGYSQENHSIKMPHNVIPFIISDYEKKILFSNEKNITIKEIFEIYKWTNHSIHTMKSEYPWLIWKAFDLCRVLFDAEFLGLNSSFQFSIDTLNEMRKKLKDKVQKISKRESDNIIWNEPEAIVLDYNNEIKDLK